MNAIKFIQIYGFKVSKYLVNEFPNHLYWCPDDEQLYAKPDERRVLLSDIKRFVESMDLIGKYHSIDHAKNHYNNMREALNQYQYENKDIEDLSNELEKAIADYESIYSIPESVRQAILNLEMHL